MNIITVSDFPSFCSTCLKMPYSAGRLLASKIAYSARNSAGRIYPSLTQRSWEESRGAENCGLYSNSNLRFGFPVLHFNLPATLGQGRPQNEGQIFCKFALSKLNPTHHLAFFQFGLCFVRCELSKSLYRSAIMVSTSKYLGVS